MAILAIAVLAEACQPASSAQCPITQHNGIAPAGEQVSAYYFEQGGLTTVLWPQGTVAFPPGGPGEIRADGSLAMKFPFWRGDEIRGQLMISGRRLDGDSPPAFGEIPEGYGDTGFQASVIVFPQPGCWEITARAGDAHMTFVVQVLTPDG